MIRQQSVTVEEINTIRGLGGSCPVPPLLLSWFCLWIKSHLAEQGFGRLDILHLVLYHWKDVLGRKNDLIFRVAGCGCCCFQIKQDKAADCIVKGFLFALFRFEEIDT